ncbi:KPN_02809 family neutral zinc metallopeptidase [Usitatibacter palustris]|uniref:Metalloprotease n=1 Tax=Usitatibacter palustris TaxID=2732487 RepID=A0A6M4HD30_9PROT|nr:neutral zinc metallopeptidase [Usitatibacter palustris]QJR16628.1 hypothetical protein DSM104440_03463 [Usitatibacter palustris]
MKLDNQDASSNVEDRRGMGVGGSIGVGTIVIAVIAYFLGIDPSVVLDASQQMQQSAPRQQAPADPNAPPDPAKIFVAKVLGSTEEAWGQIFQKSGSAYRKPTLVLFSGGTQTACGTGQAASGPFYCPADEKLYIDLSFFQQLRDRFKAPGDFAQAYVIAHEVGHHVQKLTGAAAKVNEARSRGSRDANQMSVRLELQADCFAGVWGYYAREFKGQLEAGDIEEAMAAATAIGDDRLQEQSKGRVVPDSFTHGSSAQRVRWFKRGMESGNPNSCDTFSAAQL